MDSKVLRFVGCPFAECRQYVCAVKNIVDFTKHGILAFYDKTVLFDDYENQMLRCIKCQQNIGQRDGEFVTIECNIYNKEVNARVNILCLFLDSSFLSL